MIDDNEEPKILLWSELAIIADRESLDPDSLYDIHDTKVPRMDLWKSAFKIGYQMGQSHVTDSKDLP